MREMFIPGKIDLGDRYGSVTTDGVIFREPYPTRAWRRPEPTRPLLRRDTEKLSSEEIMDKFFK